MKKKLVKKISKKEQKYKYIQYKGNLLREIYKISENDIKKEFNNNAYIKLNFYFEEAFQAFCNDNLRQEIFFNVILEREIRANYNYKIFFEDFISKKEYIDNEKNEIIDEETYNNSFKQLLSEFGISD